MHICNVEHIEYADAVTHAGVFHADDVLAAAILDRALGDVSVCRVFDIPRGLDDGAIVFDIGGGAYDHHQQGGNGSRENGVPYASAGLIWRDYGLAAIGDSRHACAIWERVDCDLIQGVDAADNGVMGQFDGEAKPLTFTELVSMLNPAGDSDPEYFDEAFAYAVEFAESVLDCMFKEAEYDLASQCFVKKAIERSDGHILVLRSYVPWKQALLESSNPKANGIVFVVYPSVRGGYNWQVVPVDRWDNTPRHEVPRAWWGLNSKQLQNVTGVRDAIFCHPNGFIGGAKSLSGAFQLAQLAEQLS